MRVTTPVLNFKSFWSAKNVLAGIDLMHMIRNRQLRMERVDEMSFADQFYALATNPSSLKVDPSTC